MVALPNNRWKYWNPYVACKIAANVSMYIKTHLITLLTPRKKEAMAHIVADATRNLVTHAMIIRELVHEPIQWRY